MCIYVPRYIPRLGPVWPPTGPREWCWRTHTARRTRCIHRSHYRRRWRSPRLGVWVGVGGWCVCVCECVRGGRKGVGSVLGWTIYTCTHTHLPWCLCWTRSRIYQQRCPSCSTRRGKRRSGSSVCICMCVGGAVWWVDGVGWGCCRCECKPRWDTYITFLSYHSRAHTNTH